MQSFNLKVPDKQEKSSGENRLLSFHRTPHVEESLMAYIEKTMYGISRRTFLAGTMVGLLGTAAADPIEASRFGVPAITPPQLGITFCCSAANDLYRAVVAEGISFLRYSDPDEAVAKAPSETGVLILADYYPKLTTQLSDRAFENAARKNLRIYVEYPSSMPGVEAGKPLATSTLNAEWGGSCYERAVVTSDAFGPELPKLSLLNLNHSYFVPVTVDRTDLILARVAGFDKAVYGLPSNNVIFGMQLRYPLLFEHPDGSILISTTKLSQFVTARYGPTEAWRLVWRRVLGWLCPHQEITNLKWTPSVRPSFQQDEPLPARVEHLAFRRGVAWYKKARLFPRRSWFAKGPPTRETTRVRPVPALGPIGDGTEGVLERLVGRIEYTGKQYPSWIRRSDCIGEVSMAMAFSASIDQRAGDGKIATNLSDFIFLTSSLAQGPRSDPRSPSFGLVGGGTHIGGMDIYYGDDNARTMLGTMAASALLKTDRWDEYVLRCLLANLRTTGKLGFRQDNLMEKQLQQHGWRYFYDQRFINYHPHYEAYLWACFLRAYDKTHYTPFLENTKNAIRMTVEAYPKEWKWTNGFQQERARMLLPLAWLVRIEDTHEHRGWLKHIAADLLSFQEESGAIREEMGSVGEGEFGPPKSNFGYGTNEAPLLQENGDPVCDLLYTMNFAFLGLHEAGAATGEQLYVEASDKLAKFLIRIQVHSEVQSELDGAWFRGFDYRIWDYWGSNADWGWGPWSTETGWIQSWITSVLGMRQMRTSFWELTAKIQINKYMNKLLPLMIPSEP